jgi:hypothetical protein
MHFHASRDLPMRIALLLWVGLCWPVEASSQEGCSDPVCARFEGSDLIRIRAPGRFELIFDKSEGFGETLYDLQADPDMLHDLSASAEENGILWSVIEEAGIHVPYFANNATDLELLEESGVRVRARQSGKHHRYGLPTSPWEDLGYTQTFTVYATGEVVVDYALIASRDIDLDLFTLIVKSTGAWGPSGSGPGANEAHCVGASGLTTPFETTASPFAMVTSNGSLYFADILMAMYGGLHDGSYWNEGYLDQDFRCGLWITEFNPTLPEGTSHLPLMLRIGDDMNDPTGGTKYAAPYRSPDTDFDVVQGVKVLDNPGDFDEDGFNESDGTYVVRRQIGQDVEFELHAGIPRINPAFKILDWNEPSPQSIRIDGILEEQGTVFRASAANGTLIVQLLGERNADTQVQIEGEAPEVPALPGLGGAALAAALGALGALRSAKRSQR